MRGYDYYELLGVSRTASPAEIRSAYRSLAKVMHPDAGGTAGMFRLVREAYETLTDPDLRADYDSGDSDDPADEPVAAPAPAPPRRGRYDPDYVPTLPVLTVETIPWWHQVGSRVALAPTAGAPNPAFAIAAAGWAGVLVAFVLSGVPGAVLVVWVLVLAAAGAVVGHRWLASARADRAFLAQLGTRTVFGRPGIEPDEAGERLTAELLERYLTRIPAARVCHGLAGDVGSVFADVDHAVLCGRRLVLVESKVWLPGHYQVDGTGVLWRNGHRFRGGASSLSARLAAYRALLPGFAVRGVLLLHPSRPGAITVEQSPFGGDIVPPMNPELFVREVGGWLAADPSTLHPDALRVLVRQVVT